MWNSANIVVDAVAITIVVAVAFFDVHEWSSCVVLDDGVSMEYTGWQTRIG